MTERRRLLVGSVGPERTPARPDPDHADWHLPLHLRDEDGARERIATQVQAGADVIVAPTWLTHRRALLPLGETRRAPEWTAAAVRLGRQALELGLERRAEQVHKSPASPAAADRPTPLLAASLPALDDGSDRGEGHLLPREPATERDYRDQAGILADAEPDLLLVEGQLDEREGRVALAEATQTGLPTWLALTRTALAVTDLGEWLDIAHASGVARVLLPGPLTDRLAVAGGPLPWGGLEADPDAVADWLEAGAGVMALLDGATTRAVTDLREALDAFERPAIERAEAVDRGWRRAIERAAMMAPGGAAAWIGEVPAWTLPAGFDWLVVGAGEGRRLPQGRFRLLVDASVAGVDVAHALDDGGILVERSVRHRPLRLLDVVEEGSTPIATYRREG